MYETIERFETIFAGAKLIKLEQNYRCSNVILGAANSVIKNNKVRKDKVLWSQSDIQLPITCACLGDDMEEAQWIGDKIVGLLGHPIPHRDIAVLYRINSQARHIEMALRERHIPYKTFGGQSFFERKEVKDFLGYFRLITHPLDHMALWRVINTPNRGVGIKTQQKIDEAAQAAQCPPFALLQRKTLDLGPKIQSAVDIFVGKVLRLGGLPLDSGDDLERLGLAILQEFPLDSDIIAHVTDPEARARKRDSLRQLPRWLREVGEYLLREDGKIDKDTLLDYLTLGGNEKEEDEDEKGPPRYVSLMSVHAAKGLEFPAVFIAGLEDELLPHRNSLSDQRSIDEERRLFYVAITRAKKHLFMSYARARGAGAQRQGRLPSRFLAELPTNAILSEGAPFGLLPEVKTVDEIKKQTANRLAGLKASLGKR
jgi:superfamily I DNA/RNA helicase